jgi:hypothetical protein
MRMLLDTLTTWLAPVVNPMALMPAKPDNPKPAAVWPPNYPPDARLNADYTDTRLGQGKTFYGMKPYTAGDDTRLLDWAVYARTRHPHIRQYQQDAVTTLWWVILDNPDWQMGHHQPLWHTAIQQMALPATDTTCRMGLWWLGEHAWITEKAQAGMAVVNTAQQVWQTGHAAQATTRHKEAHKAPWRPYPDYSGQSVAGGVSARLSKTLAVIPEKALQRDSWVVLTPLGDPRLPLCLQWPIADNRLRVGAFVDPWWTRWHPAMAGLPCANGQQLDSPGTPTGLQHPRVRIIDTAQPLPI